MVITRHDPADWTPIGESMSRHRDPASKQEVPTVSDPGRSGSRGAYELGVTGLTHITTSDLSAQPVRLKGANSAVYWSGG